MQKEVKVRKYNENNEKLYKYQLDSDLYIE